MLEDFLEEIYDNALILELLKEASYYSGIRQPYKAREVWVEAVRSLSGLIDRIGASEDEFCSGLIADVELAKVCFTDHSGFASILDKDIIPRFSGYLRESAKIDVADGSWTILSSDTGFLTLKDGKGSYLHSYSDPMWECFMYALNIYDPYVTRYNILGGGLGYLAYQLWRLSDGEADIYVYEVNGTVRDYSYLYGVMSLIDKDHIHIICDDNMDLVIEGYFDEIADLNTVRTIYYWDKDYYTGPYSQYIENIRSSEFTSRVFDSKWKRNYSLNAALQHYPVSEFDTEKLRDEWVVVAAGPSLNDNEEFIRDSVGIRTICTVNTSLKWFSLHDIIPDICFACDPNNSLIPYIEDYREFSKNVPIIADYVTNHRYLELYSGPRYYALTDVSSLIINEDFDEADVWSFGGTVTSMAIEAAFRMGAKKIYLVGADLSYPGRVKYAESVGAKPDRWDIDGEMVVSVEDIHVPTSKVFSEYITQIEDQISEHPDCEVINRSLHGAYFKGTYCGRWWENLYDNDSSKDYPGYFEELKKDSLILGWREKYYIFWQLMHMIESKEIVPCDMENFVIESAYKVIFDAFKEEMNLQSPQNVTADDKLTYIFTCEFWDKTDEQTQKVLRTAKSKAQNNNVLIINTSEKYGGIRVPIRKAVTAKYNDDLRESNNVNYENRTFPYFQLSEGMPDTDYYRIFLESISRKKPGRIIASRYSLLADFFALYMDITVEHI